ECDQTGTDRLVTTRVARRPPFRVWLLVARLPFAAAENGLVYIAIRHGQPEQPGANHGRARRRARGPGIVAPAAIGILRVSKACFQSRQRLGNWQTVTVANPQRQGRELGI